MRERLSQPSGAASPVGSLSESLSFSLKNKTDPNANLTGGSRNLFKKETMGKGGGGLGSSQMLFGKTRESSLGEKLKTMRPEKRKGKWFSLQELSDRLAKVRLADQEKLERAGYPSRPINQSSQNINQDPDQKKKARNQIISLLDPTGAETVPPKDHLVQKVTGPPKDHLVEKYFHPDNMSSAEKLKLELQKVRDEFKMSESDCGSARVQVALLTMKIKHLSNVLHKKDKHSRKGLHEMVQRRKKLLKYLRRTDWDSYCLILSKLGLRDNPDAKAY